MVFEKKLIRGFTIVELIVIIVVIGVLAAVTLGAYSGVRQQGRDTKRISDLQAISDTIKTYRIEAGNDIQSGSGCGGNGNGNGWFNYVGSGYTNSILSCLTDAGYLNDTYFDPSGCATSTTAVVGQTSCNPTGHPYMKYSCGTGDAATTYLYAHLESSGSEQDLIDANVCYSTTVATNYHMNYMVVVD